MTDILPHSPYISGTFRPILIKFGTVMHRPYWFPEAGAKLRFSFRTIFMAVLQIKELLKYILYNYTYQNL